MHNNIDAFIKFSELSLRSLFNIATIVVVRYFFLSNCAHIFIIYIAELA